VRKVDNRQGHDVGRAGVEERESNNMMNPAPADDRGPATRLDFADACWLD